MEKANSRIAIVGLGYVGLTLAVAFAKKSIAVAGIDLDLKKSQLIKSGKSPFYEEGFENELQNVILDASLRVCLEVDEFDEFEIDTWIITVGTPLSNSIFDLNNIKAAINSVLNKLNDDSFIVLRSTVGIGSTEEIDNWLSLKGLNLDLAMCPERTIEGDALNELSTLPQIVGANNSNALERATKLFKNLGIDVLATRSTKEAELAKLACNAFRDIQFAFANDIAMLGDLLQIDVNNSISVANQNYPRSKIPIPGPSAGPCLVKDSLILDSSFRKLGKESMASYARNINKEVAHWPINIIKKINFGAATEIKVAILGVAFKGQPSTSDIRDSMAIQIRLNLLGNFENMEVFAPDPIANKEELSLYGFEWMDLEAIIGNCRILILQNNHSFFTSTYFMELIKEKNELVVLDYWNQLKNSDLLCKVITFGGIK